MNNELKQKLQKILETKEKHKEVREEILSKIENTKEEIETFKEAKKNSGLYEYKLLKKQIKLYELIVSYYKETAMIKTAEYDFKEACTISHNPNKKLEIRLQKEIELDSLSIKEIEALIEISALRTSIYTILNSRFPRSSIAFIDFYKEEKDVLAKLTYRKEKLIKRVETNTILLNNINNKEDVKVLKNKK